jgi:L-seryl-tRNA(Ser) seleniumtransferase
MPNKSLPLSLTKCFACASAMQTRHSTRSFNATGVLLHTNLGRAPLAELAVKRMCDTAGYTNLELDLGSGKRSRRGERVCRLLARLTGAEEALVVNNCAAATILVLQTLAAGREVIVSRGQLVEIGGGFRLPDVFLSAGVTLREVGTTNRTYATDYLAAINPITGAIIRVHHSNFMQSGFVTEPSIEELVALPKRSDIPVIDDVGSGCVVDLSTVGELRSNGCREPVVQSSVAAGANLCLFSGDKLFGGPQCGIIVGQRKWIEPLRKSPMTRALRVDKVTLAALEATTEIHLAGKAFEQIPLYQMLARQPDAIQALCHSLAEQVCAALDTTDSQIAVEPCSSQVGGGSMPGWEVPSYAIAIQVASSEQLAKALRQSSPSVLCRQSSNKVLLDLRTVVEQDIPEVARTLTRALRSADSRERDLQSSSLASPPSTSPAT